LDEQLQWCLRISQLKRRVYSLFIANYLYLHSNEYGEEWHKQGILDKKQNVFDDFCAAAESLVKLGYTSPKK
jgi:hypothetical protein